MLKRMLTGAWKQEEKEGDHEGSCAVAWGQMLEARSRVEIVKTDRSRWTRVCFGNGNIKIC